MRSDHQNENVTGNKVRTKRAEKARIKAGALQNAIFNSANFSSIATDAKGVIQIFNVGAERMLGYAAADVVNKVTPADISDPPELIARAKALSAEFGTPIAPGFEALVFKAARGIEDIYELTKIRKDGSRFPAVVSVTALRDAQNAIIGYLLIGTDNTIRKQAEAEQKRLDQRLRDQQFYTRSLIESSNDALMTTDPPGIITDVNKQMEALTGCSRDELIGAPFMNFFTDPERAEAGIKLVLSEKKVADYELTARARDGKETVVSYNATTFYDRDRRLQGVFAAARDITERKRFERMLQETNAGLESANQELQAFSYSVSHDLRAPLRHILGFVDLLQKDLPREIAERVATGVAAALVSRDSLCSRCGGLISPGGGPSLSEESLRHLTTISQSAKRMGDLIDDLLDFSRIGRAELQMSEINLDQLVRETLGDFQAETKGRNIAWKIHPLPAVRADRALLRMALVNLISNAVKFTGLRPGEAYAPEGTRAEAKIEIGVMEKRNNGVVVSTQNSNPTVFFIRDNGAGFDPQYAGKLFGVFQRLPARTSSRARALGWPMSSASFIGTAARPGRKARWRAARHFTFPSPNKTETPMDTEIGKHLVTTERGCAQSVKAPEGWRSPRRFAYFRNHRVAHSVLECGGPPPLFPGADQTVPGSTGTVIYGRFHQYWLNRQLGRADLLVSPKAARQRRPTTIMRQCCFDLPSHWRLNLLRLVLWTQPRPKTEV